jgi:DNA repair exonuclease SbcCD ATPase subunit
MNDVLKEKYGSVKSQIQLLDNEIEVGKAKVRVQQDYIKTLEQDRQKKVEDIQNRISETSADIAKLAVEMGKEQDQVKSLELSIDDASEKRVKSQEMSSLLKKLSLKIKAQEEHIHFYNEHDVCPTCNQGLEEELKQSAVQTHTHKIDEIKIAIESLTDQIQVIQDRLTEIDGIETKISNHKSAIITISTKIIANQQYAQKLGAELGAETTEVGNIDEEKSALKSLAKEVVECSNQKITLVEERHYLDIAGLLLKDSGIKTKVIKQYLPVINKLVNKFLQAMDFFVSFELDESFNETIKSRHRDEFTYASFSEGEKAKIDLALLFAWRTIARMKNSASTNLLLLDEVFDGSLDINGTDYVMTILNTLGDESNVFIISHKDALFDKFRSVIRFEKHQNFSRIAK